MKEYSLIVKQLSAILTLLKRMNEKLSSIDNAFALYSEPIPIAIPIISEIISPEDYD